MHITGIKHNILTEKMKSLNDHTNLKAFLHTLVYIQWSCLLVTEKSVLSTVLHHYWFKEAVAPT
jgi:hypothetical protein